MAEKYTKEHIEKVRELINKIIEFGKETNILINSIEFKEYGDKCVARVTIEDQRYEFWYDFVNKICEVKIIVFW